MPRIRWMDSDEDTRAPVGWKWPSLLTATLFLNFVFWYAYAGAFPFEGSPIVFLSSIVALGALVVVLFFLGPACATQESGRSLFEVAEASFGTIPALGFCAACAAVCVCWVAGAVISPALVFSRTALNPVLSLTGWRIFAVLLALFLFWSGTQSLRTSARLALFTNKLGVALLIAGAIRMHEHLGAAWRDLQSAGELPDDLARRFAGPLMFIVPMAFLASDFGSRSRTRKDVALLGSLGLALPMVATLFVAAWLQRTAYRWHPGGGVLANFGLALWGGDSRRYWPWWMAISVITLFGAGRLGIRMCYASISATIGRGKLRLAIMTACCLAAAGLAASQSEILSQGLKWSASFMAGAAAVLSADFLVRRWRAPRPTKFDWIPIAALLAGWALYRAWVFWDLIDDYETDLAGSILIPYAVSFTVCAVGRVVRHGIKRPRRAETG